MRKGAGYHHGDLRRALVDATLSLLNDVGPEGFTLRAAAKLAGVSDGAPYHHFADKEALLAAVAEEGYELLFNSLEDAAKKDAGSDRERSQAMGVAYVTFAATHPAHFRIMFSQLVHNREQYPTLADAAQRAFNLVRDAQARGLSEREQKLPPTQVLVGAWGLVHGLAFLALDGHLGAVSRNPKKLEELVWGAIRALDPRE